MKVNFIFHKIYFILLISTSSFCQTSKLGYIINGKIDGTQDHKVYLTNKGWGINEAFYLKIFDSCISLNGSFKFKGSVSEPAVYAIEVPSLTKQWKPFVIENSNIVIEGKVDSLYSSVVKGSKENDNLLAYRKLEYFFAIKNNEFLDSISKYKRDSILLSSLRDSIKYNNIERKRMKIDFVKTHKNNFISLWVIESIIEKESNPNLDSLKMYTSLLDSKIRSSTYGKKLINHWSEKEKRSLDIGKRLKNFQFFNLDNKIVNLKENQSKFRIIALWASWCAPCIKEIPDLVNLYNKYDRSQLDILGVSIDVNYSNWKNAVSKYKIPYTTFSDLMGSSGQFYEYLKINTIPKLYLLDRRKRIVLKETSIAEINNKLTYFFHK